MDTIGPAQARDCGFLVGAYDYARIRALSVALHRDGNTNLPTGPGPFLVMLMPDANGVRAVGLDGSGYATHDFPAFIATWNQAVNTAQVQLTQKPPAGIVQSAFGLIAAIMRGVVGIAGGVIEGTVRAL